MINSSVQCKNATWKTTKNRAFRQNSDVLQVPAEEKYYSYRKNNYTTPKKKDGSLIVF